MTTRKSIPKTLKNKVWDTYIGKKHRIGRCFCCKKEIDSKNFDCGHIVSVKEGGPTTVENMRPICSPCNKSMGTQDMNQFKQQYFPENRSLANALWRANVGTISNHLFSKLLFKK